MVLLAVNKEVGIFVVENITRVVFGIVANKVEHSHARAPMRHCESVFHYKNSFFLGTHKTLSKINHPLGVILQQGETLRTEEYEDPCSCHARAHSLTDLCSALCTLIEEMRIFFIVMPSSFPGSP